MSVTLQNPAQKLPFVGSGLKDVREEIVNAFRNFRRSALAPEGVARPDCLVKELRERRFSTIDFNTSFYKNSWKRWKQKISPAVYICPPGQKRQMKKHDPTIVAQTPSAEHKPIIKEPKPPSILSYRTSPRQTAKALKPKKRKKRKLKPIPKPSKKRLREVKSKKEKEDVSSEYSEDSRASETTYDRYSAGYSGMTETKLRYSTEFPLEKKTTSRKVMRSTKREGKLSEFFRGFRRHAFARAPEHSITSDKSSNKISAIKRSFKRSIRTGKQIGSMRFSKYFFKRRTIDGHKKSKKKLSES